MGRPARPLVTLPQPRQPSARAPSIEEAALPSADIASPQAVAELLVRDEHARLHKLAGMFLLVLPVTALTMLLYDATPTVTKVFSGMLVAGFLATAAQFHLTSPGRFRLDQIIALIVVQMLTIVAATAYFGVFSPAALVPVFITFFLAHGNYAVLGLVSWLISSLGRLALLGALASGALADPGVIDGGGLSGIQMAGIELIVQSVLAIAFITGRLANRSTSTKVTWLLDLVRRSARRELEIASKIQTTILPRAVMIPGFEVSAAMLPASEVGGDYYDFRPTDDGCWVGIGDVSGHGLSAGLIMLMVQTSVASLTADGTRSITEIVEGVNRVVYDNVRRRLGGEDFVTFSLLRLTRAGGVVACGRHEPILVHRARMGACEMHDPEGLWLGIKGQIGNSLVPLEFALEPGDTLVLHTDGVTEAGNAARERYGIHRLVDAVNRNAGLSVPALREAIEREVVAFSAPQTDDITLVVIRYTGA
ncbi:MAG: PP2C family protein-serine/threonine phosphatase [Kofleriaceae bacterium]|nr:PP2C family protein-serine/threonine phosphatase [Kofleriaceae bacterium]